MNHNQVNALAFVRSAALQRKPEALNLLSVLCERSNISSDVINTIINHIRQNASIALHFHPDRIGISGLSVAELLLDSGFYRSQFETNLSNGKLSPTADGPRAQWENMLFGDAYVTGDLSLRPKYGSLSLMGDPYGPSPTFGSCYFLLTPQCLQMSTFCYGDSSNQPSARGTIDTMEDILGELLKESFLSEQALGRFGMRPSALISQLQGDFSVPSTALSHTVRNPNRSQYIESQVHDDLSLADHVQELVADPSFRDTHTGEILKQLCTQYKITLRWHDGYLLQIDDVPDDFRGGEMPEVARKIAENGAIHAELIGRALTMAHAQPEEWREFEKAPDTLLKYLWHCLVRFGAAI